MKARIAKHFRTRNSTVLKRKLVDEVHRIQDSVMLAKKSFVFCHENVINDYADVIVKDFDGSITIREFRRNGIPICFVSNLEELVDAHIIANAGRRKNRR